MAHASWGMLGQDHFLGQSLRTIFGNLDTGATISDVPIIISKSHFRKSTPIRSVNLSGKP